MNGMLYNGTSFNIEAQIRNSFVFFAIRKMNDEDRPYSHAYCNRQVKHMHVICQSNNMLVLSEPWYAEKP